MLDIRTKEIVSNVWIVSAAWRNDMANKWLFNSQNTEVLGASGKQVMIKTQQWNTDQAIKDVHLVFEFIVYINSANKSQ